MTNPQPPTSNPSSPDFAPTAVGGRPPGFEQSTPIAGTLTHTRDGKPRVLPPEFRVRKARLEAHELTAKHVEMYLETLRTTGRKYDSCAAAGMSYTWLKKLRQDPEFVGWEEEAMEAYRDAICKEAHRRAVDGWDEPIIGGKDKDVVVTTVRRYSDRLLELLLKRHIPEFREKWEGEVKVTGGVLVAPAAPASPEEWAKRWGGERLPSSPDRDVIDAPPTQSRPAELPAS